MIDADASDIAIKLDRIAADWETGQREMREILLDHGRRMQDLEKRVTNIEGVTTEQIQRAVVVAISGYFSPARIAGGIVLLAGVLDAGQRIIALLLH